MHINSDRLIESLTEVELMHINSCTQCATEREKLIALKVSANQISLVHPPHKIWNELKNKLPSQKQKTSQIKQLVLASAASLFFVAVGWLVWSNYSLQHQLQEVLLVNMMLEDKVNITPEVTFQQAALVEALRTLDSDLYQAHSTKQKLLILQKRRELIQEHLAKPQGNNYEFSI
jgi:hypothetical protein